VTTSPPIVEGPVASWDLAWQWNPTLVAFLAIAAIVAAAVRWHHARGTRTTRLVGLASRIMAITMLVVMGSGARLVPTPGRIASSEPATVATLSVRSPRWARVGDAVSIDVAVGLPPGDDRVGAVTAELVDASEEVIASATLLSGDPDGDVRGDVRGDATSFGRRCAGRIVWRPASAGIFEGAVRVHGADAVSPRRVSVRVIDEPLKVLLLDRPRFESRFLERQLIRDPRVEAAVRFVDPESPADPPAPLPATREAWSAFDVVVIGAVDPLPFDQASMAALVEAVVRDGVGVVWSLDASADPEAIAVSPLSRLLPVRAATASGPFTTPHAVAESGDDASWLALADGTEASREAWHDLPHVYGVLVPTAIRPTARVVATATPVATEEPMATERPSRDATMPFILVDRAGAARVVAILAETWRLRSGARGPLVDRLLAQAIAFAAEPRIASRRSLDHPNAADEPEPDTGGRERTRHADATSHDTAADRSQPLWNHPAILLALVAAFGAEWWIRGRLGDGP